MICRAINYLTHIFCTYFILTNFSLIASAMDAPVQITEGTPFKFKIGLEFQEGNHLVPWAKNNIHFQKKPLFSLNKGMQELWHLVFDGSDLEFVTPPFASDQQQDHQDLEICINTIIVACQKLVSFYHQGSPVTLRQWFNALKEDFSGQDFESLSLYETPLFSRLPQEPLSFPKENYMPVFQPQITIQHPLSYTIPLVVTLFGNLEGGTGSIYDEFEMAFPFLNSLKSSLDDPGQYFTEENGLLFLFAYTVWTMTPARPKDFYSYGNELQDAFKRARQVDAKRNLALLSRRPFSLMWKEIKNQRPESSLPSFRDLFCERVINNNKLFSSKNLATHFQYVNYGAEYYDKELQKRQDLSPRLPQLYSSPEDEIPDSVKFLLSQGIIGTGMIKESDILNHGSPKPRIIFKDYWQEALESIDNPHIRYEIDLTNPQQIAINEIDSQVDALSPPYFSSEDDSMGAYNQFHPSYQEFDASYGKAIIEFRGIKFASLWALEEMEIENFDKLRRNFLTGEDINSESTLETLPSQIKCLVLFLNQPDIFEKARRIIIHNLP
ncbi:hypothetical protein [Candidatus Odyssella thessalonicensis]|uniref:hypothetical protein n=1 Tax=Candidatus Odyssella thessalonicensis TaxID=84647 RepID=UPI000225ACC9|nr:hypothetical protein [Candidatus Odyssella thessalonicensis]